MKKKREADDDLRPEYSSHLIRAGVRGKYAARYKAGTNLVLLESDVAKVFSNAQNGQRGLRMLIRIAETSAK